MWNKKKYTIVFDKKIQSKKNKIEEIQRNKIIRLLPALTVYQINTFFRGQTNTFKEFNLMRLISHQGCFQLSILILDKLYSMP